MGWLRKAIAGLLLTASLLGGVAVSPASAHHDGWHTAACWGGDPVYAKYYTTSSSSSYVRSDPWGSHGIFGAINAQYWFMGGPCGQLGVPWSEDFVDANGHRSQYFHLPYTCDLRWVTHWANGTTSWHMWANYWC